MQSTRSMDDDPYNILPVVCLVFRAEPKWMYLVLPKLRVNVLIRKYSRDVGVIRFACVCAAVRKQTEILVQIQCTHVVYISYIRIEVKWSTRNFISIGAFVRVLQYTLIFWSIAHHILFLNIKMKICLYVAFSRLNFTECVVWNWDGCRYSAIWLR